MDSDLLPNRAGQKEQRLRDLRRECDMRADDTLKLCKEIDTLNAKLAGISPYLDALQRYSDAWYHLALEHGMKVSVAASHAKHTQDAINGARAFIPLLSRRNP